MLFIPRQLYMSKPMYRVYRFFTIYFQPFWIYYDICPIKQTSQADIIQHISILIYKTRIKKFRVRTLDRDHLVSAVLSLFQLFFAMLCLFCFKCLEGNKYIAKINKFSRGKKPLTSKRAANFVSVFRYITTKIYIPLPFHSVPKKINITF